MVVLFVLETTINATLKVVQMVEEEKHFDRSQCVYFGIPSGKVGSEPLSASIFFLWKKGARFVGNSFLVEEAEAIYSVFQGIHRMSFAWTVTMQTKTIMTMITMMMIQPSIAGNATYSTGTTRIPASRCLLNIEHHRNTGCLRSCAARETYSHRDSIGFFVFFYCCTATMDLCSLHRACITHEAQWLRLSDLCSAYFVRDGTKQKCDDCFTDTFGNDAVNFVTEALVQIIFLWWHGMRLIVMILCFQRGCYCF